MRKLAIIGASYLQLPLIEKAKEMGIETHVFSWRVGDVGEKMADYYYDISIREKEKILEKCCDIQIDGIISIASDLATITVNYVAEKMGLIGNTLHTTKISTNKYKMRCALRDMDESISDFFVVDDNTDLSEYDFTFPIIIKPTDRSGSRGVRKVDCIEKVEGAVKEAVRESFEKKAIIEACLTGKEYSVESLSYKGKHTVLAYTEKFTTGEPNYIEIGHIEPANLDDTTKEKMEDIVCCALSLLNIEYGAAHSELLIDKDNNIRIIEIGARMGGDLIGSDLVRLSTGIDYVKAVIDIAMGDKPNIEPVCYERYPVQVRYIITKEDVLNYESIMNKTPERIIKTVEYHPEKIGVVADSSGRRGGAYILKI